MISIGWALRRSIESPARSNLTPGELAALVRENYLSEIAVADAQTMRDQKAVSWTSTN
jgi:hypothetical protein